MAQGQEAAAQAEQAAGQGQLRVPALHCGPGAELHLLWGTDLMAFPGKGHGQQVQVHRQEVQAHGQEVQAHGQEVQGHRHKQMPGPGRGQEQQKPQVLHATT